MSGLLEMTVWKYAIVLTDTFTIPMPEGYLILSVQMQYGFPFVWALVNSSNKLVDVNFRLAGTGHPISEKNLNFIGTFQMLEGRFVFHLFEMK